MEPTDPQPEDALRALGERLVYVPKTLRRVHPSSMSIVGVDMELNELNPLTCGILNIALKEFRPDGSGDALNLFLKPTEKEMEHMSDWVVSTHGSRGPGGKESLLSMCEKSDIGLPEAKKRVEAFFTKVSRGNPVILLGTSIRIDYIVLLRLFDLSSTLFYRTIDMATVFTMMEIFTPGLKRKYIPPSTANHYAMDDIRSTTASFVAFINMLRMIS